MPGLEERTSFTAGEITLAATLTLPAAPPPAPRGRYPGALLLPSYLPRDRDGRLDAAGHPGWFGPAAKEEPGLLARLAGALAAVGVATLRYDKRGCGDSEGSWAESDWFTLVDDARDAIVFMRSRRDLDLSRCAIVGHGEGAAIAMSVAIGDPAIGALTLIGAAARGFRDVLRRQVAVRRRSAADRVRAPFLAALDRWSEDLIERADRREERFDLQLPGRAAGSVTLRLAGWHQAFETPPIALATMLHRSVALVHGASDRWVDAAESRLLERALREAGNDVGRRALVGVGHDLAEAPDVLLDELAADLVERLVSRALPPVLVAIDQME